MPKWTIDLSLDGDQWCALIGDDLMAGTAGFGPTPAEALSALIGEMESGGAWPPCTPPWHTFRALFALTTEAEDSRDAQLWRWFRDRAWVGTNDEGQVALAAEVGEPAEVCHACERQGLRAEIDRLHAGTGEDARRKNLGVLALLADWRSYWHTPYSDDLTLTGKQTDELCTLLNIPFDIARAAEKVLIEEADPSNDNF